MPLAVGAPPSPAPAAAPTNNPFSQSQREYWAFQKVTRLQAPAGKQHPVDSFVAAKLAIPAVMAENLKPARPLPYTNT